MAETFNDSRIFLKNSQSDKRLLDHAFVVYLATTNANQVNEFRRQLNNLETDLIPPQTQPTTLTSPLAWSEVAVNKRPLFIFGLSLALGVLLGLLVTGVMREVVPEILRQMREAKTLESKVSSRRHDSQF